MQTDALYHQPRTRRPVASALLPALLVFFLSLLADVTAAGTRKDGDFYVVRSKHYVVQTDVNINFAREIGHFMDFVYEEYSNRLKGFDTTSTVKFHVRIYENKQDFIEFLGNKKGMENYIGVFYRRKRLLCSYLGDGPKEKLLRTLTHEGFHQFMFTHISRNAPPWLDEGLAEYFQNAIRGRGRFRPEILPRAHLIMLRRAIQKKRLIRPLDLMTMHRRQWNHNLSNKAVAYLLYSEAWSLAHFLLHGDSWKIGDFLDRYLEAIKGARVGPGARKEYVNYAFGDRFDTFVENWRGYVDELVR
jgi:hypothetical protein